MLRSSSICEKYWIRLPFFWKPQLKVNSRFGPPSIWNKSLRKKWEIADLFNIYWFISLYMILVTLIVIFRRTTNYHFLSQTWNLDIYCLKSGNKINSLKSGIACHWTKPASPIWKSSGFDQLNYPQVKLSLTQDNLYWSTLVSSSIKVHMFECLRFL